MVDFKSTIEWKKAADIVADEYGTQVDYKEEFFVCPECGEPILKEDYPEFEAGIEDGNTFFICPVCEEHL